MGAHPGLVDLAVFNAPCNDFVSVTTYTIDKDYR